jgi:hypothetical protein
MATVMLRPLCPSYWVVWLSMGPFYLYDIFGPCFPNIIYALSLMANFTLFESISPLYAPMGVSMVQGWTLSCQVGFCMCFNHMRRWMHIPTAATLSDGSFKRGVAWQLLLCCVICTVQSIIDAIVAVVKDMGMNVGLLNVAVSFLAWNLFALFWLRMPFFYIGMLISQICEHAEMNARQLRLLGGFVDLMCVGWLVNLAVTAMNPNPTAIPHPGVANYTRIAGAWIQIFNVAPWVLVLVGLARARSFLGGVLSHPCARRRRGQARFPRIVALTLRFRLGLPCLPCTGGCSRWSRTRTRSSCCTCPSCTGPSNPPRAPEPGRSSGHPLATQRRRAPARAAGTSTPSRFLRTSGRTSLRTRPPTCPTSRSPRATAIAG